jgi:hypothetical protein
MGQKFVGGNNARASLCIARAISRIFLCNGLGSSVSFQMHGIDVRIPLKDVASIAHCPNIAYLYVFNLMSRCPCTMSCGCDQEYTWFLPHFLVFLCNDLVQ